MSGATRATASVSVCSQLLLMRRASVARLSLGSRWDWAFADLVVRTA
jgi:hypothetical protein